MTFGLLRSAPYRLPRRDALTYIRLLGSLSTKTTLADIDVCKQISFRLSSCESSLSTAIETRNHQNTQTEAYSHIFDINIRPHLREELLST